MKKTLAAVLCIILAAFGSVIASAENDMNSSIRDLVITGETKPFTFRNGITWAMNPQQVALIENTPMKQSSSSEWSVLISESQVQVSRFNADLVYMFRKDALRMITYEFTKDCSTLNFQYLTGALCSLYGENKAAAPAEIKGWMDLVYQNYYNAESIRQASVWTAEDGTAVYLYYFKPEAYAILYVCPQSGGSSGGYDTNGL